MKFQATYQGVFNMPQTGNQRYLLVIGQENTFAETLAAISTTVLQTLGPRIWKGITCQVNSFGRTEYVLWVEPNLNKEIEEQSILNFRVDQCTPFPGNGIEFSHGVSIKVSVI